MLFSVVICTYNRGDSLRITLDSFFAQEGLSDISYELVMVDNNSNDHTKELIYSYAIKYGDCIKYCFELNQGLSFARNRGIRESNGDVIAFTDDDVIIDKGWLSSLFAAFSQYDADVVGGRVLPIYPLGVQPWVKENQDILCGPIVFYDQGQATVRYAISKMGFPFGANMSFRKKLFNIYGLFRTDLGAGVGTIGEDTEFCMRFLHISEIKAFYVGGALIWHPAPEKRMTMSYFEKWMISAGRFEAILLTFDSAFLTTICYFGVPRYLILIWFRLFISSFFLLFNKREWLKCRLKMFRVLGMILQFRKSYLSKT